MPIGLESTPTRASSLLRQPRFYLVGGLAATVVLVCVHLVLSVLDVRWPNASAVRDSYWAFGSGSNESPYGLISAYGNHEYWNESRTPIQNHGAEGYVDQILEHGDDAPSKFKELSIAQQSRRRAIILPTFVSDLCTNV